MVLVAMVTGGTRGIGLAIARALVGAGVHVAVTGRHDGALSDFDEAVRLAPSAVLPLHYRAGVHMARGDHAAAVFRARLDRKSNEGSFRK